MPCDGEEAEEGLCVACTFPFAEEDDAEEVEAEEEEMCLSSNVDDDGESGPG